VACALRRECGVSAGDRVLIWRGTDGDLAVIDLGIQLLGAVTVGLIPSFSPEQAARAAVMTDAKAIFADAAHMAAFKNFKPAKRRGDGAAAPTSVSTSVSESSESSKSSETASSSSGASSKSSASKSSASTTSTKASTEASTEASASSSSPSSSSSSSSSNSSSSSALQDDVIDVGEFRASRVHQIVTDGSGLEAFMARAADADASRFSPEPRRSDRDSSVFFSSGTTGPPKGVVHTHRSLLANADGVLHAVFADEYKMTGLVVENEVLLLLHFPASQLHHSVLLPMMSIGAEVAFDEQERAPLAFQAVRPTMFFTAPIGLQISMKRILGRVNGSAVKRVIVGPKIKKGRARRLEAIASGEMDLDKWLAVRDARTVGKIRAGFGGRLRMILISMARSNLESVQFFWGLGVMIFEILGSTEANLITTNTYGAVRLDSTGRATKHARVRVSKDGELEVGGDLIFDRYLRAPALTSAALTSDGYYRTGDIGTVDKDGFVRLFDRKSHRIKLVDGTLLSPQTVETALQDSTAVLQIAVVGDEREFLVAIVHPDPSALTAGRYDDPGTKAAVMRALTAQHGIKALQGYETVRNVVISSEPFTVENGLITETKKLKRQEFKVRFASEIERAYAEGPMSA
jgi:long-chain acyl-CoA synthetase